MLSFLLYEMMGAGMDRLLNWPTWQGPEGLGGADLLFEVTPDIFCWKVNQITIKRHKVTIKTQIDCKKSQKQPQKDAKLPQRQQTQNNHKKKQNDHREMQNHHKET